MNTMYPVFNNMPARKSHTAEPQPRVGFVNGGSTSVWTGSITDDTEVVPPFEIVANMLDGAAAFVPPFLSRQRRECRRAVKYPGWPLAAIARHDATANTRAHV